MPRNFFSYLLKHVLIMGEFKFKIFKFTINKVSINSTKRNFSRQNLLKHFYN